MKRFIAGVAGVLLAAGVAAQVRHPGDRVLDLAGRDYRIASEPLVKERLQELMDHLQLDTRAKARFLANVDPLPPRLADQAQAPRVESRLRKSEQRLVLSQLTLGVVVARHDVVLHQAVDSVIIAGGNVKVSFATNSVIVARGNIEIAHEGREQDRSGLYVTRGRVEMSNAMTPLVYAMRGVKFSHFARVTAYNTDVNQGGYGTVTRITRPPAFSGELARRDETPSTLVSSGPQFAYVGKRCEPAADADAVGRYILRHAGQKHACASVESVEARCVVENARDPAHGRSSTERWVVTLCGKSEEYEVVLAGNAVAMNNVEEAKRFLQRHQPSARPAPSPEVRARLQALSQEALVQAASGNRSKALALYDEMIVLDPTNGAAFLARAHLRKAEGDAKGALADYSSALESYPDRAEILASRGLAFLDAGDPKGALADLNAAVERDNSSNTPLYHRALAHLYTSDLPRARTDFDRILARSPRHAEVYEMRMWARLLARDGAFEDAAYCVALRDSEAAQRQRMGYAVLGGYLALRQRALDDKAAEWLRQHRSKLTPDAWPDALVLHYGGELPADAIRRIPLRSFQQLEPEAFLGLDALYAARAADAEGHFRFVIDNLGSRYSLARAIAVSGLQQVAGQR